MFAAIPAGLALLAAVRAQAIRGDRRAFRLAETLERLGLDDRADSIAVVNDWYGHLFPDRLDEVADVLDARRTQALASMAA
ncbi:hypothetical protein OG738_36155 [Amycolatopsis sp. NBC_01488]|uniref:hypothetical protein n=1 Tax=Amycolatopsis sp. NBC_01488 TaxID=2903563 RepID=UPI002E2AF703|nr:hypothetical protein [Amycolatopsis sp. NBC_01488]